MPRFGQLSRILAETLFGPEVEPELHMPASCLGSLVLPPLLHAHEPLLGLLELLGAHMYEINLSLELAGNVGWRSHAPSSAKSASNKTQVARAVFACFGWCVPVMSSRPAWAARPSVLEQYSSLAAHRHLRAITRTPSVQISSRPAMPDLVCIPKTVNLEASAWHPGKRKVQDRYHASQKQTINATDCPIVT